MSMRSQGHVVVQTGDKTRLCTHSVGERRGHTHGEREARQEGPVRRGTARAPGRPRCVRRRQAADQEREYNSRLTSTSNGAVHSFLSFFLKSSLVYFKL